MAERGAALVTGGGWRVGRALALGLVPALCLAVLAGAILSDRARRRIGRIAATMERIIAGDLRRRLPTRGGDDPFDKLAGIVNRMLDRIESLLREGGSVKEALLRAVVNRELFVREEAAQ